MAREFPEPLTYDPLAGPSDWLHVIYGHIPDYQQGFIYHAQPSSQGIEPRHLILLGEHIKQLAPLFTTGFALAIVNLGRGSTAAPGICDALAILMTLRIQGAPAPGNRSNPVFAHAIVAVNRQLTAELLLAAYRAFKTALIGDSQPRPVDEWYLEYLEEHPKLCTDLWAYKRFMGSYLERFADLPTLEEGGQLALFEGPQQPGPRRFLIQYQEDLLHPEALAGRATQIAAILYQSDIPWSSVQFGAQLSESGPAAQSLGVVVSLMSASVGRSGDGGAASFMMEKLPPGDGELACYLFQAAARRDASEDPDGAERTAQAADFGDEALLPEQRAAAAEPDEAMTEVPVAASVRETGAAERSQERGSQDYPRSQDFSKVLSVQTAPLRQLSLKESWLRRQRAAQDASAQARSASSPSAPVASTRLRLLGVFGLLGLSVALSLSLAPFVLPTLHPSAVSGDGGTHPVDLGQSRRSDSPDPNKPADGMEVEPPPKGESVPPLGSGKSPSSPGTEIANGKGDKHPRDVKRPPAHQAKREGPVGPVTAPEPRPPEGTKPAPVFSRETGKTDSSSGAKKKGADPVFKAVDSAFNLSGKAK